MIERPGALFPAAVLAASAALSLAGCIQNSGGESSIRGHRALWRKQEPELYSYTVRRSCHCLGGPVQVIASRDSVLSVHESEDGVMPYPAGMLTDKKQDFSIEAAFDEVDAMVNRPHASHSISFDGNYGYPDSFDYDESLNGADDEFGLTIADFTVLNPEPDPYDGQGVRSGTATLTLKGYPGLCRDLRPEAFGCPIVSIDGGEFRVSAYPIKGFDFQWGRQATLKVEVTKAPEDWQDVPDRVYTLIGQTRSSPAPPERFQLYVLTRDFKSAADGVLSLDMDTGGDLSLFSIEPVSGIVR